MARVLTYGTFDLLHYGHIKLLQRARALGAELHVGLSTDGFNKIKGKVALMSYEERRDLLLACRCVDYVFPEKNWGQKGPDIARIDAKFLVMGDDWVGKFDEYSSDRCQVRYFERTPDISSTMLRERLAHIKAA